MEINVLIEEEFEDCLEAGWLKGLAEQVLTLQEASAETELGLVIAGQERVRALNKNYRGKDVPTDVLAFSTLPDAGEPFILPPDGRLHLGEVIISYPQAVIQAGEESHSVEKEMATLITHGVLHLLGFDDETPELREQMRAREQEILSRLEI
ncbi:MAG: rRNA maturation RNase YbeY [Dehalococcoidales bacterium]|nr:rRNA maturation RNase YbeY [Dehalococcoidales bacterium]